MIVGKGSGDAVALVIAGAMDFLEVLMFCFLGWCCYKIRDNINNIVPGQELGSRDHGGHQEATDEEAIVESSVSPPTYAESDSNMQLVGAAQPTPLSGPMLPKSSHVSDSSTLSQPSESLQPRSSSHLLEHTRPGTASLDTARRSSVGRATQFPSSSSAQTVENGTSSKREGRLPQLGLQWAGNDTHLQSAKEPDVWPCATDGNGRSLAQSIPNEHLDQNRAFRSVFGR